MSLFYSLSLLGKFWQEKMNHFMVRGTIFCILGQIIVLFFTFSNLPTQVPLYYTLPWGESRLAPVANLFLFPLLSVLVLVVDSLMAMYYSRELKLLSRLLMITSLVFSFFSLIGLLHIIFLVS